MRKRATVVRLRSSKYLHRAGNQAIGAGPHVHRVHRVHREPHRIDTASKQLGAGAHLGGPHSAPQQVYFDDVGHHDCGRRWCMDAGGGK